ncbi:MAG TPA: nitroreductase/quinone reductase family protein [Anaerolineales bacterium]
MTRNDFVKFFLRSPLHVFMGHTMLITVTGHKTGRRYSTPVGFSREGNSLWVLTRRDRTRGRNVPKGARVSLLLKGKSLDAFAEAELEEKAVESRLLDYIRHIPMAENHWASEWKAEPPMQTISGVLQRTDYL